MGRQAYNCQAQAKRIPLIGAWSGQMRDTAMFRPSNGTWYVRDGITGASYNFAFGDSTFKLVHE